MWKNIVERLKTEETKLGKILIKYFGFGGILSSLVAYLIEAVGAMPQDFVDLNIKKYLFIASLVLAGIGKLTKKSEPKAA